MRLTTQYYYFSTNPFIYLSLVLAFTNVYFIYLQFNITDSLCKQFSRSMNCIFFSKEKQLFSSPAPCRWRTRAAAGLAVDPPPCRRRTDRPGRSAETRWRRANQSCMSTNWRRPTGRSYHQCKSTNYLDSHRRQQTSAPFQQIGTPLSPCGPRYVCNPASPICFQFRSSSFSLNF